MHQVFRFLGLIGKPIIECVAPDSKKKIQPSFIDVKNSEKDTQKWRQVNITLPDNFEIPLMLSTLYFSKDQKFIVVGRDLQKSCKSSTTAC
jgi:hypothetical protein